MSCHDYEGVMLVLHTPSSKVPIFVYFDVYFSVFMF